MAKISFSIKISLKSLTLEFIDCRGFIINSTKVLQFCLTSSDFAEFLLISQKTLFLNMNDYLFVNTGDVLILNTTKNLKACYRKLEIDFDNDKLIRHSIFIIRDVIKESGQDDMRNISAITKNNATFKKVQDYILKIKNEYGR